MIDKLEIRVPALTPFSKEFDPIGRDLRRGYGVAGFRPSRHYTQVGDLRQFGINALAHLSCKHGFEPHHKLELLNTGQVGFDAILTTMEKVFDFQPMNAAVMRIDCAADIEGVSVSEFQATIYAAYKRWVCDIGEIECLKMGAASVETIYLGKRPNCIRIYNKVAEYQQQYKKLKRRLGHRACALPFERLFQINPSGVLTRVERQIGGGRVPLSLSTVRLVLENAISFNPFEHVRLVSPAHSLPMPNEIGLAQWLQGMHLRELVKHLGLQRTRKFLNRYSKGNSSRILNQFAAFLPIPDSPISAAKLYESYRSSVARQLGAEKGS